jgi:hypothetical protein
MFALVGGNVRYGGEDIGAVGSGTLDAVSVVYAALPGFVVDVEVLEVVVKVNGASAEVAAEESCMSSKDGGDIDVSLSA